MGEITNQIAIAVGVLVACVAGPAAAIYVLLRRKAKARQSRRSPIGIALLRGPGRSLRERLDETHNDLTWDLVLLMVVPLLALATFLAQSHLRGLPQTAEPLEQAERQAAWLAKRQSSAVGSPASVLSVVALPGWFVERTGGGRVRTSSVKELAGLLKSLPSR